MENKNVGWLIIGIGVVMGIMVLMFGSPDYPTWYICWYAPFVMIAPTYQTRMALMLLLVWNFPGESIALLPDYVIEAD